MVSSCRCLNTPKNCKLIYIIIINSKVVSKQIMSVKHVLCKESGSEINFFWLIKAIHTGESSKKEITGVHSCSLRPP